MKRTAAAISFGFAVLSLFSACSKQDEYPASVKPEFMSGCLTSAREKNERAPEGQRYGDADMEQFCSCTWEGISRRVSFRDFMVYENTLKMGGKPEESIIRAMSEVTADCGLKIMKK